MNERDKHLSLAIDGMTKAYEIAKQDQFLYMWMDDGGIIAELKNVQLHLEAAADMPKPSKIRDLFQRLGRAA
jgi:hypothetical protein